MIRQTLDRGYCDMPSLDGIDWRNPVHTFRPERAG
jgi:hypothetical protein